MLKIGTGITRIPALITALLATPALAQPIQLDVQAFRGGYGVDFFEKSAREFTALNPNTQIKLEASPRVWEILTPRFAAGTPPDLAWPGWKMNIWPIVWENQLLPWDKYLDQPAHGSSKTWRETFVPGLLKMGQYQGKTYILPYNFDAYGWWYDKALFDKHGWQPPATYEELLVLSEKMKKEGIAPVTFTGRYPFYALVGILYPWVISAGGIEAYQAAQNLEPGAWKHPAFLKAARRIMEMKRLHNFQPGCIGMSHTESQMELLTNRAAMIPCGTWLHAEMSNLLPPGFVLRYMKTPVFADGKGDPSAVYASPDGKGWVLPARGKNPDQAAEFFRYTASPAKSKEFIETKGTLMSIITEETPKPPPHLETPLQVVRDAKFTWAAQHHDWYATLQSEAEMAFVDMYNEVITPEEFLNQIEVHATQIRNNPSIVKMKAEY